MVQIYDPTYKRTAIVTSGGELLTTGSPAKSESTQTQDVLIERDTNQILVEILKEQKKMNIQLENMTDLHIENKDINI